MSRAGPSSAPPSLSLRPSNVLTIFLARFHVRHGNQIEFQYPPAPTTSSGSDTLVDVEPSDGSDVPVGINLDGLEWKVLPSGGHLIESDVIYFSTPTPATTGVACFRNVKLNDDSQRGARMVSIGLILQCDTAPNDGQLPSALAQQLAIVPHLANLESLADQLAHYPTDTAPLKRYYEQHRSTRLAPGGAMDGKRMAQLRMRRRRDPKNLPHDPISHMPALCGSLGALLPHIIKKLMLPQHRLLIYSPSPPLVHAARLGYNLAELISLAMTRSAKRHENLERLTKTAMVQVRGQIGVHDITALQEEEDKLRQRAEEGEAGHSWIAWTTDKILLEKPQLFDSVVDLSGLISRESRGVLDDAVMESATSTARLLKVVRTGTGTDAGMRKVELKAESWTTRELATFNELDAQAQRHAERAERLGPAAAAACVSKRRSKSSKLVRASRREADPASEVDTIGQWRGGCASSPRRSGAGTMSAILAFLRFWLAGWWFLPSQWRYGLPAAYVLPLGIRGDGGVRASILLMPEDDESDGESDHDFDESEQRQIAADDQEDEQTRRSRHLGPPDVDTREDGQVADSGASEEQTGTNSSSDTDDYPHHHHHHHHHHHTVSPDPLLAAVGASRTAESDRLSISHHSLRRRSTDRSLGTRVSISDFGGGAAAGVDSGEQDAIDLHTLVSDALWMVWSHWTVALVSGLLEILEDRLAQIEADGEQGEGEEEALISKVKSGLEVQLGPADMASLGLSAANPLDAQLVQSLGASCLQLLTLSVCHTDAHHTVTVNKGCRLFRWLL